MVGEEEEETDEELCQAVGLWMLQRGWEREERGARRGEVRLI